MCVLVCACVDSKRLRVQIENVSLCAANTPVSHVTRAFCQRTRRRFESTHAHTPVGELWGIFSWRHVAILTCKLFVLLGFRADLFFLN